MTSWAINRLLSLIVISALLLTGCSVSQVSAEQRLFLDLSVDFLDEYILPQENFEATPVGGLSALTYDVQRDRFYALSDDRGNLAPPRFYTLKAKIDSTGIEEIAVEGVTLLKDESGNPFNQGELDPEGIVLTPGHSLIISSEGSPQAGVAPLIAEFDLTTGQLQRRFRIPDRFLPDGANASQTQGVQENLSFEALTIAAPPGASSYLEPFRLFAATEGPLLQDLDEDPEIPFKNRLLHYLISQDQSTLLSEHWYSMGLSPLGAVLNGLSELLVLDPGGHFLGLERAFGLQGFTVKLYQLATGVASDTSGVPSLKGDLDGLNPIRKQLVFDLNTLDIDLENLEGMTLGPQLQAGSQSLILMSDNNFDERQRTQFLLFRLNGL